METVNTIRCFSCGANVPDMEGPTHRYMSSSPGCWHLFGKILEREYSDPAYWKNHRITVDCFAVQHYGAPSPQAIHSVNLHLSSLYLMYRKGFPATAADKGLTALAKYKHEFVWLTPPKSMGDITVTDILAAANADEHCRLVDEWGRSVWNAWQEHHATVEAFVKRHEVDLEKKGKA